MTDRTYRMLNTLKVSHIKSSKNSLPNNNQGKDGDISTGTIKGNEVLFVKINGNWRGVHLKDFNELMADISNNNISKHKLGAPDYDSQWIQAPVSTTSLGATENVIRVNHNLNCKMVLTQIYVKGAGSDVGEENDIWSINSSNCERSLRSTNYESGVFVRLVDGNSVDISFGDDAIFTYDNYNSTDYADQDITEGYIRVLVWKAGVRQ
tara:strand:- start:210 stop:833 length:624 start_codon:yes stop_codon:yes gene_type:complete